MKSGIYYIKNKINGKIYVGSSFNINYRFTTHKRNLRNGTHVNVYLQRSYDKHGLNTFEFGIFEETDNLFEREDFYINSYDKSLLYNIGTVGGGDNLTNHPDREAIIEKMKVGVKKAIANRTQEMKDKISKDNSGENNPNYGNKWDQSLKDKVSLIVKKRFEDEPERRDIMKNSIRKFWNNMSEEDYIQFCENRKKFMTENNPFKGKTHSKETKQKLSEITKNKFLSLSPEERYRKNPQSRLVMVDGIVYHGSSEAGRQLGISPALMTYRLKSKNIKWANYQYAD